jgi:hypothetical protein
VGIVVGIDPNGPLPGPPFKTKRDSCERDRFDGMLLKKIVFFFSEEIFLFYLLK